MKINITYQTDSIADANNAIELFREREMEHCQECPIVLNIHVSDISFLDDSKYAPECGSKPIIEMAETARTTGNS